MTGALPVGLGGALSDASDASDASVALSPVLGRGSHSTSTASPTRSSRNPPRMHRKNVGSHGFRRASRGTARHRSHSVVGEALWSKMGGATVSGGTAERTCSAPNQTHSIASFAAHRSNNQYVSHALCGNQPVSRVP